MAHGRYAGTVCSRHQHMFMQAGCFYFSVCVLAGRNVITNGLLADNRQDTLNAKSRASSYRVICNLSVVVALSRNANQCLINSRFYLETLRHHYSLTVRRTILPSQSLIVFGINIAMKIMYIRMYVRGYVHTCMNE